MKWFRQGQRSGESNGSEGQASGQREGRELYLPGAVADESLNEGRGFVLLGGGQPESDIAQVQVDADGRSYVALGGRRHLADVPDILPKDEQEVNRLDFEHHLLRYTMRGNYAAPVQQPTSILDVGCGTGRWAVEMAALFPAANVIGLDVVSPASRVPGASDRPAENYLFVSGNVLDGMPFSDASFDFVHMRLLFTAIPSAHWPAVVRELVRVTRPGGWIELVEGGLTQNGGPALDAINSWISQIAARRGIDLTLGAAIAAALQRAGLANVVFRDMYLPVGRYGGRTGQMTAADTFALLEGLRPIVTAQSIASPQTYDRALATARVELDQPGRQCVRPFYVAYGSRSW